MTGSRLHLPHGTVPTLDALMWALAVVLVIGGDGDLDDAAGLFLVALAVCLDLAAYFVLLRGRVRFATQDEVPRLLVTDVTIAAALIIVCALRGDTHLSRGAAAASGAVALTLHLVSRWACQRLVELRDRPRAPRAHRVIVLGAGYGGTQAIRLMLEDHASSFQPVGILDDDPAQRHLRINGVRVLGPWSALDRVAKDTGADMVVLAVPSAQPSEVSRVLQAAHGIGLEVRLLPPPDKMMGRLPQRRAGSSQTYGPQVFRPPEIADLLGRRAVDTDLDAIAGYLTGERVLVTGAGGSIGSQLCREISRYEPARLIMVDRDESALHAVQLTLDGEAMLDSPDLVLGDLRTPGLIEGLFTETRPTIVFHAAALKHLTLTERFPEEAFLTNVAATQDLLLAAASHGVTRFINISTDKAADPGSVLGYSKRVAERLTATIGMACAPEQRFISVRFGNVLGSRGSALLAFASQLEHGLPMTVTDPDMERFFMSVDEACQLVLQAGVLGHSGEVLVLDMGQAHNIEAIARRFAALAGYPDAEVTYTGARPGEKTREVLLGSDEEDLRPHHPLITQAKVPPVPRSTLQAVTEMRARIRWRQHTCLVRRWLQDTAAAAPPTGRREPRVTDPLPARTALPAPHRGGPVVAEETHT